MHPLFVGSFEPSLGQLILWMGVEGIVQRQQMQFTDSFHLTYPFVLLEVWNRAQAGWYTMIPPKVLLRDVTSEREN